MQRAMSLCQRNVIHGEGILKKRFQLPIQPNRLPKVFDKTTPRNLFVGSIVSRWNTYSARGAMARVFQCLDTAAIWQAAVPALLRSGSLRLALHQQPLDVCALAQTGALTGNRGRCCGASPLQRLAQSLPARKG